MNDETYAEGLKVVSKAKKLKWEIRTTLDNVKSLTKFEAFNREKMRNGSADKIKERLVKAIDKLERLRNEFKELKFPENK